MSKPITYKGPALHKGQQGIVKKILKGKKKFNVVNASRQSGKSFLLKNLILYFAINNPNTVSLVVSPFVSQNQKIFDELITGVKSSGVIKRDNRSEKTIEFINGSKLYFKSAENADAIRGGSYDYIFCDEFAFYKKDVWEVIIRPTMAAKKDSIAFIFSTPRGTNEFYDLCQRGQSIATEDLQYDYFFMTYQDNPLMDLTFIEDCRRTYPKSKFGQEFLGEFIDAASVFEYQQCAVISEWSEPEKGIKYYAGLDLANKGDYTVLTLLSEDGEMVYQYRINQTKWSTIVDDVVKILKKYNNAHCLIEVNSIGDVIYELIEDNYTHITPIFTANKNKQEYIEALIYEFNTIGLLIPTKELAPDLHLELDVFEMSYSPKTRKTVYSARAGFHDDTVISLSIANKCMNDHKTAGEYFIHINGKKI